MKRTEGAAAAVLVALLDVPWAAFHCAYEPACPTERVGVVGRLAK